MVPLTQNNLYRIYEATSLRVHAPNTLDARLHLGFGVSLDRRLSIRNAVEPRDDVERQQLIRVLIRLCSTNKPLLVVVESQRDFSGVIDCDVYAVAHNAPESLITEIDSRHWVSVSAYFRFMNYDYDLSVVKEHLRRSSDGSRC